MTSRTSIATTTAITGVVEIAATIVAAVGVYWVPASPGIVWLAIPWAVSIVSVGDRVGIRSWSFQ